MLAEIAVVAITVLLIFITHKVSYTINHKISRCRTQLGQVIEEIACNDQLTLSQKQRLIKHATTQRYKNGKE